MLVENLRPQMRVSTFITITLILTLIVAIPHAYASQAIPWVFLTSAVTKSVDGASLSHLKAGQQIQIETNVTNSSFSSDKPIYTVIVVRDNDGKVLHIGWQSASLAEGDKAIVSISWLVPANAKSNNTYEIRCVAIDQKSGHMLALSNVYQTKVSID